MTRGKLAASSEAPHSRVVPVRHYGRWVTGLAMLLVVGFVLSAFATTDSIDYSSVINNLFDRNVLIGVRNTLLLTVLAMVIGIVLGVILAAMRLSSNPIARSVSFAYVWFMRGTPVLVQLVFWFNLGIVFDQLSIGVPGTGLELVSWNTNSVITPFVAALFGLGLNEGAWMAEVVRGGIIGVDRGQTEAAHAIGMTPSETLRQVVLPQAVRIMIPATGNEVLNMLKATALASVISYPELLQSVQNISAVNFKVIELLMVASIWYLAITTVLSIGQSRLERHYGRSLAASSPRRRARKQLTQAVPAR